MQKALAIGEKAQFEALGTLRAAFEATGSPRWIMSAIKKHGLDAKHGFRLEVDFIGDAVKRNLQSTESALVEGAVDFIDTDWLSIARCRSQGMKISAVLPYGRIMGGLVVPAESPIHTLEDLRGRRIGVVTRFDKNWTVTRAVSIRRHGFDPQAEGFVEEALSKTALLGMLEKGRVDAALLFWHLIPRLTVTKRFRQVYDVLDLLPELGVGRPPTTFFTFRDAFIAGNPHLIRAFAAAFGEAVELMRSDDDVWEEISITVPREHREAFLMELRARWESRITTLWNPDVARDLHRLFEEILRLGGPESTGFDRIPEGTFTTHFMS